MAVFVRRARAAWTPSWVDNTGTGYLAYDGASLGADSAYFDLAFLVRGLDQNTATVRRLMQTNGARVDIRTDGSRRLAITLQDTSAATLVAWTSTSAIHTAGEWLYRIAADLSTGSPTCTIRRAQRSAGVVGAFEDVPGTFATGPLQGTIDQARGFSGNDLVFGATLAGANIVDWEIGYIRYAQTAPVSEASFVNSGGLVAPQAIGSPEVVIMGPAASIATAQGSLGITFTATGSFADS